MCWSIHINTSEDWGRLWYLKFGFVKNMLKKHLMIGTSYVSILETCRFSYILTNRKAFLGPPLPWPEAFWLPIFLLQYRQLVPVEVRRASRQVLQQWPSCKWRGWATRGREERALKMSLTDLTRTKMVHTMSAGQVFCSFLIGPGSMYVKDFLKEIDKLNIKIGQEELDEINRISDSTGKVSSQRISFL